jgi:hypothetical protein
VFGDDRGRFRTISPPRIHERMNSPLEGHEVHLRGLWPRDRGSPNGVAVRMADSSVAHRDLAETLQSHGAPSE